MKFFNRSIQFCNRAILKFCNDSRRGYLMVELVVAIGLLTIALFAMLGVTSRAISLNRFISDRFIANYLAVEGLEVTKNLLDANRLLGGLDRWDDGFSNGDFEVVYNEVLAGSPPCGGPCDNPGTRIAGPGPRHLYRNSSPTDPLVMVYAYDTGGERTPFTRVITVQLFNDDSASSGNDRMQVNSVVAWTGRGGIENEVNIEAHFFRLP